MRRADQSFVIMCVFLLASLACKHEGVFMCGKEVREFANGLVLLELVLLLDRVGGHHSILLWTHYDVEVRSLCFLSELPFNIVI